MRNYLELTAEALSTELNLNEPIMGCDLAYIPGEINPSDLRAQLQTMARSHYVITDNACFYFNKKSEELCTLHVTETKRIELKNLIWMNDASVERIEQLSVEQLYLIERITQHRHDQTITTVYRKIERWLHQLGADIENMTPPLDQNLSDEAVVTTTPDWIAILVHVKTVLQEIKRQSYAQRNIERTMHLHIFLLDHWKSLPTELSMQERHWVSQEKVSKKMAELANENDLFDALIDLNHEAFLVITQRMNRSFCSTFIEALQDSSLATAHQLLQMKDLDNYLSVREKLSVREAHALMKAMSKYYLDWIPAYQKMVDFILKISISYLDDDLKIIANAPSFRLTTADFSASLVLFSQKKLPMPQRGSQAIRNKISRENEEMQCRINQFINFMLPVVLKNIDTIEQLDHLLEQVVKYYTPGQARYMKALFEKLATEHYFERIQSAHDFLQIFHYFGAEEQIQLLKQENITSSAFYAELLSDEVLPILTEKFCNAKNNFHPHWDNFLDCFPKSKKAIAVHTLFKRLYDAPKQEEIGYARLQTERSINNIETEFAHKNVIIRQIGGLVGLNAQHSTNTLHYYKLLAKTKKRDIYSGGKTHGADLFKIEFDAASATEASLDTLTFIKHAYEERIKYSLYYKCSLLLIAMNHQLFYTRTKAFSDSFDLKEIVKNEENEVTFNQLLSCFAPMRELHYRSTVPDELALINQLTGLKIRSVKDVQDFLHYEKDPTFNMEYTLEHEVELEPSGHEIQATSYTACSTAYYTEGHGKKLRVIAEKTHLTYACFPITEQRDFCFEDLDAALVGRGSNRLTYQELTVSSYALNQLISIEPQLIPYIHGSHGVENETAMMSTSASPHSDLPKLSFNLSQEEAEQAYSQLSAWLSMNTNHNLQDIEQYLVKGYLFERARFNSHYPKASFKDTHISHIYAALFTQLANSELVQTFDATRQAESREKTRTSVQDKLDALKRKREEAKAAQDGGAIPKEKISVAALIARAKANVAATTGQKTSEPSAAVAFKPK